MIIDDEQSLRAATLDEAMARSFALLERVLTDIVENGRDVKGVCVLYSGGNDSTVLAHLMRSRANFAVHINTGIGIEETRRFVRRTCDEFGLPLIEEYPPEGCTYDELVLRFGFPGPAGHMLMFSRLKERGLRAVRRRFVERPRRERVVFLAGMRVFESRRRWRNTEETRAEGSVVWVSPLAHWTDEHMSEYRARFDVPENEVSKHLHMSGECLCGAFAKPGELDMVAFFYPDTAARIRELEAKAKAAGVPCTWGQRPARRGRVKPPQGEAAVLCAGCTDDGEGAANG